MYLYRVDNAVTYTSEDLVLFRESPFACWMERLTLENPDHGIPPDSGSEAPGNTLTRQDDIAATLRDEGKDVVLIDWDAAEPRRRSETLEAMRQGADFIVNGQLALGPLSGSVNLLMRTSGYSQLGDYLYIPCDTQARTTLNSAFRLCFLADLLHSLQGQLPPQMLIIRGGDLVPLQTEEHIYHYRAVKHRFMQAMRDFRKHRMPDPSASSHFGRWSDCANEVLKQRALRAERQEIEAEDEHEIPEQVEEPQRVRAIAGGEVPLTGGHAGIPATTRRTVMPGAAPGAAVRSPGGQVPKGPTLAEQARLLAPRVPAGDKPLAPAAEPRAPGRGEAGPDKSVDTTLEGLAFIRDDRGGAGETPSQTTPGTSAGSLPGRQGEAAFDPDLPDTFATLPLPEVEELSLDGSVLEEDWPTEIAGHRDWPPVDPAPQTAPPPALKPVGEWVRPHDAGGLSDRGTDRPEAKVHPLDSLEPVDGGDYPLVDRDGVSLSSPPPGLDTSGIELPAIEEAGRRDEPAPQRKTSPREDSDDPAADAPFSDSLITSESLED
jgi:hypothetical protein